MQSAIAGPGYSGNVQGGIVVQGNITAQGNINIVSNSANSLNWDLVMSPELFGRLQGDVKSNVSQLLAVLSVTEGLLSQNQFPIEAQVELDQLGQKCHATITGLQALASQFDTWHTQNIQQAEIHSLVDALLNQIHALESINQIGISIRKLERTLQRYIESVKRGDSSSIITKITRCQLDTEGGEEWRLIQQELEAVGITAEQFRKNEDRIMKILLQASQEDLGDQIVEGEYSKRNTSLMLRVLASLTRKNRHLFAAAKHEGSITIKQALEQGAYINARELRTGFTALHHACRRHDLEDVKLLLRYGANVNIYDKWTGTPLSSVLLCGGPPKGREPTQNVKSILDLLVVHGTDINQADFFGSTPIVFAVWFWDVSMVALLLKHGSNVNLKPILGLGLLHYAIEGDSLDVMNLLIEKGADINKKCDNGTTPLMFAVYHNRYDAVKSLVERGAKLDETDNRRNSAYDLAVKKGANDIVQYLAENGGAYSLPKIMQRNDQ